jgi:hypothetical protein
VIIRFVGIYYPYVCGISVLAGGNVNSGRHGYAFVNLIQLN